jgi:hypothetical protein
MLKKGYQKVTKMLKNGVPGAPRVPEGAKTLKSSGFCLDLVWIWPLLESFLDTFSVFFVFRASGTLKKGVRERVQN